jgi:transcriptional regulator with XRE-family HTH domain
MSKLAELECKRELGAFLRSTRERRKRTLEDVALAIGRSKTYVCDVEAGRRGGSKMPADIVSMWAGYLNIPVATIAKMQNHEGVKADETAANMARRSTYMRILRSRSRSARIFTAVKETRELLKVTDGLTPADMRDLLTQVAKNVEIINTCLKYT